MCFKGIYIYSKLWESNFDELLIIIIIACLWEIQHYFIYHESNSGPGQQIYFQPSPVDLNGRGNSEL